MIDTYFVSNVIYVFFCFSLQGLVMPPQQQHPPQGVMHPNPRNTILFPQQPPQSYSSQGIMVQNRPPRWPLPMMQPQQQSRQFPNQSALIAQLTQPTMGTAVNPTALAVTGQFNQSKCLHFLNYLLSEDDCLLGYTTVRSGRNQICGVTAPESQSRLA